MDSYDNFDDIIEYDADGSSEKENEETPNLIFIKQPKTTKDQFNKIASFVNEHTEAQTDHNTYNQLWENLAASLNDIGPPDHTTSEWKRIWSVHKNNKKRKRLAESTESDIEVSDQPSCSVSAGPPKLEERLGIIGNQSELSMKLDVVIENQTKMIANQQVIIQELQSSNKFLEAISKQT